MSVMSWSSRVDSWCGLASWTVMTSLDPYTESGRSIFELVNDGLKYLDTRTDFWRQQKPMYARKRDKIQRKKMTAGDENLKTYVVKELEKIDESKETKISSFNGLHVLQTMKIWPWIT